MKWIPKYMAIALLTWMLSSNVQAEEFDSCAHTIMHQPRADVSHNPSPFKVPERTKIPLTIDLAETYGIDIPIGTELDTEIGVIEIDGQGGVFYNNEDISSDIKDKCDNDSERGEATESKENENGDYTNAGGELP